MNQTIQAAQSAPGNVGKSANGNGSTAHSEIIDQPQGDVAGQLLTRLREIKDAKELLAEKTSALNMEEQTIKNRLIQYHFETELEKFGNSQMSVSFKPMLTVRVDPEHWTDFFVWVSGLKSWHVLKKEVLDKQILELAFVEGVPFPEYISVESFTNMNTRRK